MLWNGGKPKAKHLKENMETYFNFIQGFLFLAHGSKVGAGPTLSSCIDVAVKQVVHWSFNLFKDSLPLYESETIDEKNKVPQLVGAVWDACTALKKVPTTNITAIGRAIAQVGVSMKDVLREMQEMRLEVPGSEPIDDDDEDDEDGDLCNVLSPEEMKIAESAMEVVSETIVMIKELIRSITGLVKRESSSNTEGFVECLEKLMKACKETGRQIDELGACLYPPHEVSEMDEFLYKMDDCINDLEAQIKEGGFEELLSEAFSRLRSCLKRLKSDFDCACVNGIAKRVEELEVVSN
ncbi:uncharacterized protein LOC124933947 isoform X2 [Impatiens glandulifera]|nr:uncharacterized protein LOC124933947 isoform X2 [Impatiens glandulifera]